MMEGGRNHHEAERGLSERSIEDLEDEEQNCSSEDVIHDLRRPMMESTHLVQTASTSKRTTEGDDAPRSLSVNEKLSHHKQLETVRNEEHMGGAFLVQRRCSPRHSPSSCSDGLSPLLSEEELNIFKLITRPSGGKGSDCFTNKVLHLEPSQGGSDSDTEGTDGPSP